MPACLHCDGEGHRALTRQELETIEAVERIGDLAMDGLVAATSVATHLGIGYTVALERLKRLAKTGLIEVVEVEKEGRGTSMLWRIPEWLAMSRDAR
jgi:predicted ArsR family transcriptional regulator